LIHDQILMLAMTNVRQEETSPATRRMIRNDECLVAVTNQDMATDSMTENESDCVVTCVVILQNKSTNQNINKTVTCSSINEDIQHHTHTQTIKVTSPKLVSFFCCCK